MSRNVKISIALVIAALAVVLLVALMGGGDDTAAPATDRERAQRLVRSDSQRLSSPTDSKATFVEFLDFECEACGAAYPGIEQLRSQYGDRVTFVVRNFPLHSNSEAAARAAEAAGAQGKFEEMYKQLFETQRQWAERSDSQETFFFDLARGLGLDMTRFRTDYDDPATLALVRRDKADGEALNVTGTPTFFLDGEKVDVSSFAELAQQVDDAASN